MIMKIEKYSVFSFIFLLGLNICDVFMYILYWVWILFVRVDYIFLSCLCLIKNVFCF